ncbi:hypothetical protein ABDK00_014085 [Niabella insulamsoli]|uniref:hypothetical protein n=1 Tax=Niabella insulamsoli TaxID=3144874 RepID=UPI0031FE2ADC
MSPYKVRLQRPGMKSVYERDVTTNSNGHPILTGYPAGLLNRGETFKATIHNAAGDTVQFVVESNTYSCIQITFVAYR